MSQSHSSDFSAIDHYNPMFDRKSCCYVFSVLIFRYSASSSDLQVLWVFGFFNFSCFLEWVPILALMRSRDLMVLGSKSNCGGFPGQNSLWPSWPTKSNKYFIVFIHLYTLSRPYPTRWKRQLYQNKYWTWARSVVKSCTPLKAIASK